MKSAATINIELDKSQIIDLIGQLEITDRIELLDDLRQSTFLARFQSLLRELRTDDLQFEEITKAVEEVRQSRFESGKQND